jgi:signal peptidase I
MTLFLVRSRTANMRSLWRFLFWAVVFAGALVGVLRAVAFRWWRVPTNDPWLEASVEPSLRGGDFVLLWRLTPPHFGDLVLCPEPNAAERVVVGRVFGEPGDTIAIEASSVTVNNHSFPTERACTESRVTVKHPRNGQSVEQGCDMEEVGGSLHARASTAGQPDTPTGMAAKVPAGHIFLVSDNRLFPFDSRDYGPVERGTCRESVFYRLWGLGGFFDVGRRFTYIP